MDENGGWFMTIFETLIAALRGFGCLCKIQRPRKPLKRGQKEIPSPEGCHSSGTCRSDMGFKLHTIKVPLPRIIFHGT